MKRKLGIIGTSNIAFNRFLPALMESSSFEYAGVATRTHEKAIRFAQVYQGEIFDDYNTLIRSPKVDALYLPLPPALHKEWAMKALENGKHILLEKPFTTSLEDTRQIIELARAKDLAVHENYMFVFHKQVSKIKQLLAKNAIGELRQMRTAFGFPFRGGDDFRYNKELGGGALLDCGGYPVKLACILLGENLKVSSSRLNVPKGFDVDIFGSATLENEHGLTAQIAFGMDNFYRCEVEIWGSCGFLSSQRIFTAPADFKPQIILQSNGNSRTITVESDNQFLNSIEHFASCIVDEKIRNESYAQILKQAELIERIKERSL